MAHPADDGMEPPPAAQHVTLEEASDEDAFGQETVNDFSDKESLDDNEADGGDDDFGDFDDFDELTEAPAPEYEAIGSSVPAESVPAATPAFSYRDIPQASKVLPGLFSLENPTHHQNKTHLTPTSQMLWTQLMETPQATLLDWSCSAIHRLLAVSLGAPLNLDQSLPKAETRKMVLPAQGTQDQSGLPDTSLVPHWRLLSLVSETALASMTPEELSAHTATIKAAIDAAEQLQEELDNFEMGLHGEKEVLEGMVESMLVYAQKNQRDRLAKARKA